MRDAAHGPGTGPPHSGVAVRCAVRERREAAGLSVSALAAQVGLSRQALSRVESGAAVPGT
ncbi:helix-turn-helix transcriptional regulator, partial [Deinococcus xianganensis]